MKRTKRLWTRSEKLLFLAPSLLLIGLLLVKVGPTVGRTALGLPQVLSTESDNHLRFLRLSNDGRILATTGVATVKNRFTKTSGSIYLRDAQTLNPLPPIKPNYSPNTLGVLFPSPVYGLAFSPDNRKLGFSHKSKTYTLLDLKSRQVIWESPFWASQSDFSGDGTRVALNDGTQFAILDATNGRIFRTWKIPKGREELVRWSPNSQLLASISGAIDRNDKGPGNGGKIELRDRNGKKKREIGSSLTVSFNFSPDGLNIVSTGGMYRQRYVSNSVPDSAYVRCFELKTGNLKWEKLSDPDLDIVGFRDAVYSPDGKTIAAHSAHQSNQVMLLEANTGREIRILPIRFVENTNMLLPHSLAFSPDSKRLFARGQSEILVWTL